MGRDGRVTRVVKHILVSLPDRVREQSIAAVASVHKNVLRIAFRARKLGRADAAREPYRSRVLVHREA